MSRQKYLTIIGTVSLILFSIGFVIDLIYFIATVVPTAKALGISYVILQVFILLVLLFFGPFVFVLCTTVASNTSMINSLSNQLRQLKAEKRSIELGKQSVSTTAKKLVSNGPLKVGEAVTLKEKTYSSEIKRYIIQGTKGKIKELNGDTALVEFELYAGSTFLSTVPVTALTREL